MKLSGLDTGINSVVSSGPRVAERIVVLPGGESDEGEQDVLIRTVGAGVDGGIAVARASGTIASSSHAPGTAGSSGRDTGSMQDA
jgi:hypothetical protein